MQHSNSLTEKKTPQMIDNGFSRVWTHDLMVTFVVAAVDRCSAENGEKVS